MRTQRRVGLGVGIAGARPAVAAGRGAIALAAIVALAACGDAPERASEAVDTAALEDRRMFEGEIGRDTAPAVVDDTATRTDTAITPPVSREPTLVLAADSAAGFLLYHRSAGCIACHGADAEGLENLGPSLRDGQWLHIDGSLGEIARVIREGIARPREAMIAMPALASRLDAAETYKVSAYIYALSHPGAVAADTTAARDSLRARGADTLDAAGTVSRDTTPPPAPNAQARRHQR